MAQDRHTAIPLYGVTVRLWSNYELTDEKDRARREAAAHEAAAIRHVSQKKRAEHELAARLLRKAHQIPEPITVGNSANRDAQRAELERINQWKESR